MLRWLALLATVALGGCTDQPPATPPISPGTSSAPRDVNLIARDYLFLPETVDIAPGETVVLHVVNGGLDVHEAVIGDARVQDAWEAAEAAVVGAPPGPTPVVSVPPERAGVRVVVASGGRVDVTWTAPVDPPVSERWLIGCHIPGHWEKGMVVPIRWIGRDGKPLTSG